MLKESEPLDPGLSDSPWQLPEVVNRWSWGPANPVDLGRPRASVQSTQLPAAAGIKAIQQR